MANNKVFQDGYQLSVVVTDPAAPNAGDPVRYGLLTGVALTDEGDGGNAATATTVDFGPGVWDLSVVDEVGGGIAVGDALFYDDALDGITNDPSGNYFFGFANEAIGAGLTATIQVIHAPAPGSGTLGAGTIATANLAAGILSADAGGRAKFAAGVFDAATALSAFGADSMTNAFLLDAVQNGAFVADAATRALFAAGFVSQGLIDPTVIRFTDTKLESADVKALKATPIELVAAPGANLGIVPVAVAIVVDYGGTNAFTETADDLSIGYAAGAEIKEIESIGLIDQANDEWRYITFEHAETFIPEENVAVVITNLDDEIAGNAGNDNEIHVRLYYRTVPTDGFIA